MTLEVDSVISKERSDWEIYFFFFVGNCEISHAPLAPTQARDRGSK